MSNSTVTRRSSAAAVRAWAAEQSFDKGFGARGRFSPEVIEAFNRAHRTAPYVEGEPATVAVKVKTTNGAGKTVIRTAHVPVGTTRTWARENGHTVKAKGAVPAALVEAHALALVSA